MFDHSGKVIGINDVKGIVDGSINNNRENAPGVDSRKMGYAE